MNHCDVLATGATCDFYVDFYPQVAGGRQATLNVSGDGLAGSASITLIGTGVQPTLGFTPTSVDFGHRPASKPGAAVPVTITNTSKVTITLGTMTVTPPNYVQVTDDQCSNRNLEPAQSCSLLLTYPAPGAPKGTFQGSLTFLSSIRPPYHARIDLIGSLD